MKEKLLNFFKFTKSKSLFIISLFFIGYLLTASLTYVWNQCWIKYFTVSEPYLRTGLFTILRCTNYVDLMYIFIQYIILIVSPLLVPLIKTLNLYNLYANMPEYFVSLVSNIRFLILEYLILCIFYWLYWKVVIGKLKPAALIIAIILIIPTIGIFIFGLVKSTHQPDSVTISRNESYVSGGIIRTQAVKLTDSTVAELLKETKALSEDNRFEFDIPSYIDSFSPRITGLGLPCFFDSRKVEYHLVFFLRDEVVQKTWVAYADNANCAGYQATNWKTYNNFGNRLEMIFKDKSNKEGLLTN